MLLLTPGPLTTSPATRAALTADHGSRDPAFLALSGRVREGLRAVVAAPADGYTCVPVQGSGSFGVEAALGSFIPRDRPLVVGVNGAYGARIVEMARRIGHAVEVVAAPETEPLSPALLAARLALHPRPGWVAWVAHETTTGLVNPNEALAAGARAAGWRTFVDAMSAYGALPMHAQGLRFDVLVASANKLLEGVPGVAFAVVADDALAAAPGHPGSLVLDLVDQARRLAQDGQWRFTPPTHVLAALDAALAQHAAEGGAAGRLARYSANRDVLVAGMREMGFETLLPDALLGPVIVTFRTPGHPAWEFEAFYAGLVARGFAIYPGKLTAAPSFRVGCIGQVFPADMRRFLAAVRAVLDAAGVPSGAPA
jgi:2-aminoethylphosphonate-pyruvate transaminase